MTSGDNLVRLKVKSSLVVDDAMLYNSWLLFKTLEFRQNYAFPFIMPVQRAEGQQMNEYLMCV